jgi:hypothetical protein
MVEVFFDVSQVEYPGEGIVFIIGFFADLCKWYAYAILPMRARIWVSCFGEACFRAPAAITSAAWASVHWTVPADVAMKKADGTFVVAVFNSWDVCRIPSAAIPTRVLLSEGSRVDPFM